MKKQFPAFNTERPAVFLDSPGGTQMPQSVIDAMVEYMQTNISNVGGYFSTSKNTLIMVESVRKRIAEFFNAPNHEDIFFDQNATSLIFKMSRTICRDFKKGDKILVTKLDHTSNISPWQEIAYDTGCTVEFLDFDKEYGGLTLECFPEEKLKEAKLVTFTLSSNVTGVITKDLKKIIKRCKKYGCLVFVDAVHYAAHHKINIKQIGCDFLVCSAYKFYGPHIGIGYANTEKTIDLKPYKVKAVKGLTPGKWETGTLSFEAIAGLEETIRFIKRIGWKKIRNKDKELCVYFLYKTIESPHNITVYGTKNFDYKAGTYSFNIEGYDALELHKILGKNEIYTWAGDFYASYVPEEFSVKRFLRIGFSLYNSINDIDALFDCINNLKIKNKNGVI